MVTANDDAAHLDVGVPKLRIIRRQTALVPRRKQREPLRIVLQLIRKAVAVILEIRIQEARKNRRSVANAIVSATGKSVARPEILVLPQTRAIKPRRTVVFIRHRLQIVDTAPFPIIRPGWLTRPSRFVISLALATPRPRRP